MNAVVSETVQKPTLTFTDNAATKVKGLIEEEGNNALKLRIFISGGDVPGFHTDLPLMKPSMKVIR